MLLFTAALVFITLPCTVLAEKSSMSKAIETIFHIVSTTPEEELPEKELFIALISETYSSLIEDEMLQFETFTSLETYFLLYPEAPKKLHEAVQAVCMHCASKGIGKMSRDELRKIVQIEKKNREKQLEKQVALLKKHEVRTQLRQQKQEELERSRTEQRKRAKEQRHLKLLQEQARKKYADNQKARKESYDKARKAREDKEKEERRKQQVHAEKMARQEKLNKQ